MVCGTNAFNPMCRHYTTTSPTSVAESEVGGLTVEEEFSGKGFCPHDPRHNSTAIFSEGNLYAATAADFSGLDALIITKRLRTQQYDLKQLNRKHTYNESNSTEFATTNKFGSSSNSVIVSGPDFVGAIEDDSHVFFFFRELALESSNCGKVRMRLNQPEIMLSYLTFGSVYMT